MRAQVKGQKLNVQCQDVKKCAVPARNNALKRIVIINKQLKRGNMCMALPTSGQADANIVIVLVTLPWLSRLLLTTY